MKQQIFYLYTYSLTHLKKSNRVRAVYALKGRNHEKGMIGKLRGKFLCNGCFIIPEKNNPEIIEVLKLWNIKYQSTKIMLMN